MRRVKGATRAIIHFYNSTSVAQREQVFHKSKEEIKQIAVDGAKLVKKLSRGVRGQLPLRVFSPESFTGTEPEYALEVCNAVLDVLEAHARQQRDHQPAGHRGDEHAPCLRQPDRVYVQAPEVPGAASSSPCIPTTTGAAAWRTRSWAVLAGADRIEGTLFGNGERTGNVDVITLAMNMYCHGVDPQLDFSNMPAHRAKSTSA